MATILYVPVEIANAFNTYELGSAYNGLTNLSAILSKYANVTFRADTIGNKSECNCAPSIDGYKFNTVTMPFEVWFTILADIATKIDANQGGAANWNAEYIAPYFLNIGYWHVELWNATYAGAFYASRNPIIAARFVPQPFQGGNSSIAGKVGIYGNTFADANIVNINVGSALNGKSMTVTIYGIGVDGSFTSVGSATAAVSNGVFSASISATLTPSATYYIGVTNINLFNNTDYNSHAFKVNVDYGKGAAGVNAGLQIDLWSVVGA